MNMQCTLLMNTSYTINSVLQNRSYIFNWSTVAVDSLRKNEVPREFIAKTTPSKRTRLTDCTVRRVRLTSDSYDFRKIL